MGDKVPNIIVHDVEGLLVVGKIKKFTVFFISDTQFSAGIVVTWWKSIITGDCKIV